MYRGPQTKVVHRHHSCVFVSYCELLAFQMSLYSMGAPGFDKIKPILVAAFRVDG